ncbi:hypothetical protein BgAZ_404290 [Babesia gibsoni]|uniref:Uncharacterized protein n=1 Tax=Babesia gibsoni TaxID=33632 RepID=A0AAD8PD61_BABGI|nr:hypothetical protein BgAZ_404290 [Babesia gibsoni]
MWRLGFISVILIIAISDMLNPIYARKLVHLGCGLTLAHINLPNTDLRNAIVLVAFLSIVVFKTYPLRFGVKDDIGIIWYNLVVLLFVALGIPLRLLFPVFVVDPVACLVGLSLRSKRWYRKKTVCGSFAALIASYCSLYYVKNHDHRLLLTVILPITEGVMDKHDNIGISFVVMAYYWMALQKNWKMDFYISFLD